MYRFGLVWGCGEHRVNVRQRLLGIPTARRRDRPARVRGVELLLKLAELLVDSD
jgi:hypothetical protein